MMRRRCRTGTLVAFVCMAFFGPAAAQMPFGWRVGPAAWSFNQFSFFEAIDKTASIGMGYPVLKVESQNEHPSSTMVWFEAKVGPPAPGGSIAYAISWAPTDGTVAYAVVAGTPELRSEVVAAMAGVA